MSQLDSSIDRLQFSTVCIKGITADGNERQGTGFIYLCSSPEGNSVPLLVTCKHIFRKVSNCEIQLHHSIPRDGKCGPSDISPWYPIDDFNNRCIYHPKFSIDLCVIPFQPIIDDINNRGFAI